MGLSKSQYMIMSSSDSQKVTRILTRIKSALGVDTDVELANCLNIKGNRLAMWRKRDSIDYDLIFEALPNISPAYIISGIGPVEKSQIETLSSQKEIDSNSVIFGDALFYQSQ